MYCNFFGFSERPFEDVPDLKFLYLGRKSHETLDSLISGIRKRLGLMVLTGIAGVGKSVLLRAAAARLGENTKLVEIVSEDLPFDHLPAMALIELGASRPQEDLTESEAIHRLKQYAARHFAINGNLVFVVKDSQNLDNQAIKNLQDLSDFRIHNIKAVQVVLCGTPELETNFGQLELGTFTDSIHLRLRFYPLTAAETHRYIAHRLAVVNRQARELFDGRALKMIWKYTGGVPLKINTLCDTALRIGYETGKKGIGAEIVKEAVEDLSWEPFQGGSDMSTAAPVEDDEAIFWNVLRRKRFVFGLAGSLVAVVFIVFAVRPFLGDPEVGRRWNGPAPVLEGTRSEATGVSDITGDSVAFVRQRIDKNPATENDVAIRVKEITDTGSSATPDRIVENQELSDASQMGNVGASGENVETLPEEAAARPMEEKPRVASAERSPVREPSDEKAGTAPAPPATLDETDLGSVIIQLGAYREKANAKDLKRRLSAKGYDAYLDEIKLRDQGTLYRVRMRCCSNAAEGRAVKARLSEQGFGDAFIVARRKN